MDILFDVGVSIVYNWLLLIGVLIGCIVAANNKKGMPFLWIGCAIQAVAVFGTVIGMRRDGLTTTGILCIVNYLVLTGLAFLLIDSIQDKAEKRDSLPYDIDGIPDIKIPPTILYFYKQTSEDFLLFIFYICRFCYIRTNILEL